MKKNNVLVLGYPQYQQVTQQIKILEKLGANVISIEPYGEQGLYGSISWSDDQLIWQGVDIRPQTIQGVLVNAHAPDFPQESCFNQMPDKKLSWVDWYLNFAQQRDRSDMLMGLCLSYELHGIPLFNSPGRSLLSRRKPFQIQVLKQQGCPLPETLISNDPVIAKQFIDSQSDVILKPAAGGALTVNANDLDEEQLEHLRLAPAILQQRIYGDDIRVIVLDDSVISSAVINVPKNTLDFRGNVDYQQGHISYQEIHLPEKVVDFCVRAVKALGLRFGGIDLKHTLSGDYYMLECNSSPIYLDVENKLGHPITEQLCRRVLGA